MGLRSLDPDIEDVEQRKARLVKLQKYFKIIPPLLFIPLVQFIVGVVTGSITGENNIITFGLWGAGTAIFGVAGYCFISGDLKRRGDLPNDVFRERLEIWKPLRIPILAGTLLIVATEVFIVFSFPDVEGLILAVITASAISAVLVLYIKRAARLPWNELMYGKKE